MRIPAGLVVRLVDRHLMPVTENVHDSLPVGLSFRDETILCEGQMPACHQDIFGSETLKDPGEVDYVVQ